MPRIFLCPERRKRQRGVTLVIFTILASFVLIPMAGLAIDMSIVFWAKARLSAAVDAAAWAGGRTINASSISSVNKQAVQDAATLWFNSNFPTGWMGTTPSLSTPGYTQDALSGTQTVTINASASVPLYFARVIGYNSMTIYASAQSTRRSSYVVLVLDRSLSIAYNSSGNACPTLRTDAVNFVNMFTESFDTLALVTYSSSAGPKEDYGPSQTFKAGMASVINNIQCVGFTSMAQALHVAYSSIQKNGLKSGLNVIVLFTDGQPNTIVQNFTHLKAASDTRYGSYYPGYVPNGQADYNTSHTAAATSCAASSITGGLTALPIPSASTKGLILGFWDTATQVAVNSEASALSGSTYNYCNFLNTGYIPFLGTRQGIQARDDIAYLEDTDAYGNSIYRGYGNYASQPYFGELAGSISQPATFSSGTYSGHWRPDYQVPGVMAAAVNAADYQAQAILHNTDGFSVTIYTIGLGGAPDFAIDATLMERMANDSRSPIHDRSVPSGMFAYASNPSQLNQAFTQIASQILQLTK